MTCLNKQICILLLSIADCYNTIVIQNTASCCSKHTMFDWSLSGKMYWLTDKDVIYCCSLFVLNREMSNDSPHVWAEKGESATYTNFFIHGKLIRLCSAPTVWLTGDLWEAQCRNITAISAEPDGKQQNGTCRLGFEVACARNVKQSWDWILILTPCSDSLTKAVRFFQLFPFECQRAVNVKAVKLRRKEHSIFCSTVL